MDTATFDRLFEYGMNAAPWLLCLGSLAYICIGLWLDEWAMRRTNRLASTIELSAEAWEMATHGELTPTEYCQGAERLYAALLKEPDDPSEEFRNEFFECPVYMANALGAFCRRVVSGWIRRVRQLVSTPQTEGTAEGSGDTAERSLAVGIGGAEVH